MIGGDFPCRLPDNMLEDDGTVPFGVPGDQFRPSHDGKVALDGNGSLEKDVGVDIRAPFQWVVSGSFPGAMAKVS